MYEVWTSALLERNNLPLSAEIVNTLNGCMGLFTVCALWVAVPVLALVPDDGALSWVHESFAWPTAEQGGYLVLNATLALLQVETWRPS